MIRCIDVGKVYRQGDSTFSVLERVSFDVPQGQFAVIMGPSGSGKSTLLHLIGGLDRPSTGDVLICGRAISQMADDELTLFRRTRIGFVFQFFNLLPTLTALENVALPLVLDGRSGAEAERKARVLLEQVGLDGRRRHLPEELSGGEIQRVAIARALVFDPAVLLADEPTGNLDRQSGREVLAILEELNSQGITLIVVTHNPEIGERARRCLRLVDGRIVSDTGERGHAPA